MIIQLFVDEQSKSRKTHPTKLIFSSPKEIPIAKDSHSDRQLSTSGQKFTATINYNDDGIPPLSTAKRTVFKTDYNARGKIQNGPDIITRRRVFRPRSPFRRREQPSSFQWTRGAPLESSGLFKRH